MSTNLTDEQYVSRYTRFTVSPDIVKRRERQALAKSAPASFRAHDEEWKFVARAATWMFVLALTPLILFCIVNFFYPILFLIPVTPN